MEITSYIDQNSTFVTDNIRKLLAYDPKELIDQYCDLSDIDFDLPIKFDQETNKFVLRLT